MAWFIDFLCLPGIICSTIYQIMCLPDLPLAIFQCLQQDRWSTARIIVSWIQADWFKQHHSHQKQTKNHVTLTLSFDIEIHQGSRGHWITYLCKISSNFSMLSNLYDKSFMHSLTAALLWWCNTNQVLDDNSCQYICC